MKLNNELKSAFEPLRKFVIKAIKDLDYNYDEQINIYVKTPHIIYRKVVTYMKADFNNDSLVELTSIIESGNTFNTKDLQAIMAVAYMNYFSNYNSSFNDPFYRLIFRKEDRELKLFGVIGSESPDPIDAEGIQIRK